MHVLRSKCVVFCADFGTERCRTAGADGFLVPKHQLQTRLTFRPYFCSPSEHGINMIAFPAILSNKTFSKNITSLPPKHCQFFVVFSSGEKTLIWGSKMCSSFVLLLFRPRNKVYFPSRNRHFLDGCSAPTNMLCFGGRTLLQVGRFLGQCFSWWEKYSPKGRHVWPSCFAPKNPSATAVLRDFDDMLFMKGHDLILLADNEGWRSGMQRLRDGGTRCGHVWLWIP